MNHQNRRLAQYGDLTWDDLAPDHGPGCDGPYNCTCEDPGPTEPPAEEAPDEDVAPECPAFGEHEPEEATSYPVSPTGRCEVFTICTGCGATLGHLGSDSVL